MRVRSVIRAVASAVTFGLALSLGTVGVQASELLR
jgi:hypothetical protein